MKDESKSRRVSDDVIVFLGPSLVRADAEAILPASYRRPAKMGDVEEALAGNPRILCIIDGFFESVPAVWHKEILHALSSGVRVVGASSMGALRAAELHGFGMEGVGSVFASFASGELNADDEVALTHGPEDAQYRAASEPLVNLRDGLRRAVSLGLIVDEERAALVEAARITFYPDRSWSSTFADAKRLGIATERVDGLRDFVKRERPNLKRDDAILSLRYIAETLGKEASPPSFQFEQTVFWRTMVAATNRGVHEAGANEALHARILKYCRVALEDHRAFERQALLAHIAPREAARVGVIVSREQMMGAATRIRRELGLASSETTVAWLKKNSLSSEGFLECATTEAYADVLVSRFRYEVERECIASLQGDGRYGLFAAHSTDIEGRECSMADLGVTEEELISWYEKRVRPLRQSVDNYAKERGFEGKESFLSYLTKFYATSLPASSGATPT